MTVTAADKIAYTEVYEVLKILDKSLIDKIPESVKRVYKNNRNTEYQFTLDKTKPLTDQQLSPKAITCLTELYIKYWAKPEDKNNFLVKFEANDERFRKEREKEYELALLRNGNHTQEAKKEEHIQIQEQVQIQKYEKKSFISRIMEKIKILFRK